MYDEIKRRNREAQTSEAALIFMWLAVGAAFGWGSGVGAIVVFAVLFVSLLLRLVWLRRR